MIQYLSKISKNTSKNKKIQRFSEALLAPSSGPQFKKKHCSTLPKFQQQNKHEPTVCPPCCPPRCPSCSGPIRSALRVPSLLRRVSQNHKNSETSSTSPPGFCLCHIPKLVSPQVSLKTRLTCVDSFIRKLSGSGRRLLAPPSINMQFVIHRADGGFSPSTTSCLLSHENVPPLFRGH